MLLMINDRGLNSDQCGHDFWLNHGAGFYDKLTDASHIYAEINLYVGDDGGLMGTVGGLLRARRIARKTLKLPFDEIAQLQTFYPPIRATKLSMRFLI